jgi:hypothetical protein
MADPFATLPEPSDPGGSCINAVYSGSGTYTLNPGKYCNISLSGSVRITLNPGVYYLQNGLSMSGPTTLTGAGVMLFNSSGSITMSGGTTVNLTAPTAGAYQGFTIFQRRTNTSSMSLSGGATQTIAGAVYVKAAALTYSGNGNTSGVATTLVADTMSFSGSAYISQPASTSVGGTGGGAVALIE